MQEKLLLLERLVYIHSQFRYWLTMNNLVNSKSSYLLLLVLSLSLISFFIFSLNNVVATRKEEQTTQHHLQKFAYATCLLGYFQKHQMDNKDIAAIAGGFLETGDRSFETYQAIANYVENFQPRLQSKQAIDPDLLKCFYLDEYEELLYFIQTSK